MAQTLDRRRWWRPHTLVCQPTALLIRPLWDMADGIRICNQARGALSRTHCCDACLPLRRMCSPVKLDVLLQWSTRCVPRSKREKTRVGAGAGRPGAPPTPDSRRTSCPWPPAAAQETPVCRIRPSCLLPLWGERGVACVGQPQPPCGAAPHPLPTRDRRGTEELVLGYSAPWTCSNSAGK